MMLRAYGGEGYLELRLKRVYEQADSSDGMRVLVDRLWPRGLTKQEAAVDLWLKEIAPSTELRRWFHHDRQEWAEFRRRYLEELQGKHDEVATLRNCLQRGRVTLLYGAKDETHNHALVLRDFIENLS